MGITYPIHLYAVVSRTQSSVERPSPFVLWLDRRSFWVVPPRLPNIRPVLEPSSHVLRWYVLKWNRMSVRSYSKNYYFCLSLNTLIRAMIMKNYRDKLRLINLSCESNIWCFVSLFRKEDALSIDYSSLFICCFRFEARRKYS